MIRTASRFVSALAAAALTMVVAAGCGGQAPAAKPAASTPAASTPAAATPASSSKALIPVKVGMPVTSLSQMSLFDGIAQGFFKKQGLKVTYIAFHGGGPDTAALLAGNIQFDWAPDSQYINLLAHGKKALNVINVQDQNIITWAMSKPVAQRLGITPQTPFAQRLKDLRGLKIGITKPGALTDQLAQYYVKRAGMNPAKDVKIVPVGSGAEAFAALKNGEVNVLVVSVPQPELAVQKGIAIEFMGVGADPQMKQFMMNSVHVLPSYAKTHPTIVRKFVHAVLATEKWEEASSPATIAKSLHPFLKGYSLGLLTAGVGQVKRAINPTGMVTLAAAKATVKVIGTPGVTGAQLFAEFDPHFLN